ncbi:hypothetical protein NX059_010422 [Plenodomus lindquistii]|nr:hypothetical protein NX059_010422 [Plenodomus lindquistii]
MAKSEAAKERRRQRRTQVASYPGSLEKPKVPTLLTLLKRKRRARADEARQRRQEIARSVVSEYTALSCDFELESRERANRTDREELHDLRTRRKLNLDHVLLYFTDGCHRDGFLGAGVAAYERRDAHMHYSTASHQLGFDTGASGDAELFAIAAALGLAKKKVDSNDKIQLVRVYSDELGLLKSLRSHDCAMLGPLIAAKTALQSVYERAQWLHAKGVAVELVWVKSHKNSKGNDMADKCAGNAAAAQMAEEYNSQGMLVGEGRTRVLTQADVPAVISRLGQIWSDEWLFRANGWAEYEAEGNLRGRLDDMKRDLTGDAGRESFLAMLDQPLEARWGLGYDEGEGELREDMNEDEMRNEEIMDLDQLFAATVPRADEQEDIEGTPLDFEDPVQDQLHLEHYDADIDDDDIPSPLRSPSSPSLSSPDLDSNVFDDAAELASGRWVGDKLLEFLELEMISLRTHARTDAE